VNYVTYYENYVTVTIIRLTNFIEQLFIMSSIYRKCGGKVHDWLETIEQMISTKDPQNYISVNSIIIYF
jgi:hypothetical protein